MPLLAHSARVRLTMSRPAGRLAGLRACRQARGAWRCCSCKNKQIIITIRYLIFPVRGFDSPPLNQDRRCAPTSSNGVGLRCIGRSTHCVIMHCLCVLYFCNVMCCSTLRSVVWFEEILRGNINGNKLCRCLFACM